jgi:hypothetical protein
LIHSHLTNISEWKNMLLVQKCKLFYDKLQNICYEWLSTVIHETPNNTFRVIQLKVHEDCYLHPLIENFKYMIDILVIKDKND